MSRRGRAHHLQFDIEGFEEIDASLRRMRRAQASGVIRRALVESAKPTVEMAKQLCPVDDEVLKKSILAGPKLNPRQTRRYRKQKGDVSVFIGPGAPHAHLVEFGTSPHINKGTFNGTEHPGTAPQPFMRPAWEATKLEVLANLKEALWKQILKVLARQDRAAGRVSGSGSNTGGNQ